MHHITISFLLLFALISMSTVYSEYRFVSFVKKLYANISIDEAKKLIPSISHRIFVGVLHLALVLTVAWMTEMFKYADVTFVSVIMSVISFGTLMFIFYANVSSLDLRYDKASAVRATDYVFKLLYYDDGTIDVLRPGSRLYSSISLAQKPLAMREVAKKKWLRYTFPNRILSCSGIYYEVTITAQLHYVLESYVDRVTLEFLSNEERLREVTQEPMIKAIDQALAQKTAMPKRYEPNLPLSVHFEMLQANGVSYECTYSLSVSTVHSESVTTNM